MTNPVVEQEYSEIVEAAVNLYYKWRGTSQDMREQLVKMDIEKTYPTQNASRVLKDAQEIYHNENL